MHHPHELYSFPVEVLNQGIDPLVDVIQHLEAKDAVVWNDGYRSLQLKGVFLLMESTPWATTKVGPGLPEVALDLTDQVAPAR